MDPLSIATAVVTFVEVAGSVGKGIRLLRSVARSDVEFCDLVNELEMLHSFMEQVVQTASDLSKSGTGAPATSLQRLEQLLFELSRTAEQLDVLAEDLMAASRPNKKGTKKVPVIQWQRHKGRALALRAQCRRSREDICAFLGILEPSLNAVNHARMMIRIEALSSSTTESIKQTTEDATRHVLGRIDNFEATIRSAIQATSTPFHGRPPSGGTARGQPSPRRHERPVDREGSNLTSVHAILEQRCPAGCGCQCHILSQLNTPTWLRYAIGGCLLRYNAIPIFDRRPCNAAQCLAGPERSMRITVNFPRWLLRRAIQYTASWDPIDTGARTSLSIPRVVSTSSAVLAINYENIEWLRLAFQEKRYLPTDVDEFDGEPLLSLMLRRCVLVFEVLSPLITERALAVCDADGRSVADLAQECLWASKYRLPSTANILKSLLKLGADHLTYSPSPIRDSILGNSGISVKQALVMNPGSLNSLDNHGCSPLHWAVHRFDTAATLLLLQNGADPNLTERSEGKTTLHIACHKGFLAGASLLLQHGANINAKDKEGRSPLSASLHCPDMVRLLLRHGADPGPAKGRRATIWSPVHHLSDYPRLLATKALSTVLSSLVDAGANLESRASLGNTPLLYAALRGKLGVVKALAKCGARIDAINDYGHTILAMTAKYASSPSQIQFLRDCIDLQLDPDARGMAGMSLLDIIHDRISRAAYLDNTFAQRPLSHRGIWLLSALVVELRERNWANGRFLETRDQLPRDGSHRELKMWIGREYLRMQYQPGFADQTWDKLAYPKSWYYYQDYPLDRRVLWYEAAASEGTVFRSLFGEGQAGGDERVEGASDSEGEDEFFDAMDVH
ncbi:hypothetical protein GGTG_08614 [Gaeumannomyces tritici R3-111a-1]|uniref:Uncharacterized protein n=1 Tax=Gaeumannomyces tritici (strain R3-111a-1) TaxID=644352 RepID=J3P528_GAET3|nr:hypothetical protein GGTG_08614 [Gaeumannomyces tritici R3-111a-1]EJT74776.1 hypothetical protein GGTG_08614 [Gaeumannomyces tritici R3-111a-1]